MWSWSQEKRALLVRTSLAVGLSLATGCVGDIGDGAGKIDPNNTGPDTEALCAAGDLPGPHPRLVRLTHTQYDNTVRYLLGLPESVTPSIELITFCRRSIDRVQYGHPSPGGASTPRNPRVFTGDVSRW